MAVATKRQTRKHVPYLRELRSKRDDLMDHLRVGREQVVAEQVPDDNWALASRTLMQDLAVGTLQRERQLLVEVEDALDRLDEGEYGVCEVCGEEIPERRLRALPWARFCLLCAERFQVHWRN